jgi:penicillin-binding protein 2
VVRENLGWEEVARLEFNAPDLPGVFIDLGQTRDYPEGELMSHIIGYTGRVSDEDLNGRDDPGAALATMRFGKKGVERSLEDDLRGRAGAVQVEVNAVGRVVRELDRTEGQPGSNALLTIDLDLQRFAAERLAEHQSGSVVVMDVITGDVLAMVSTPGFDPNTFARGITQAEWRQLLDSPERPLNNKSIGGIYPPGSTYKMVTRLAALESRAIEPWTVLPCLGFLKLGDIKFHCWLKGGHGGLSVQGAIAGLLRLLLLRGGRARRVSTRSARSRPSSGFGKEKRARDCPGESAGQPRRRAAGSRRNTTSLAAGRHLQPRHRPGLHDGDAAAARDHDRAHRQLAATRCSRTCPARQGDAARGAGCRRRPRQNIQSARRCASTPQFREPGAPGHERRGEHRPRHRQPAQDRRPRASLLESAVPFAGKTGTAQVKRITERERDMGITQDQLPWHLRHHRAVRLLRTGRQPALRLRGRSSSTARRRRHRRARSAATCLARDDEARSVAPRRRFPEMASR